MTSDKYYYLYKVICLLSMNIFAKDGIQKNTCIDCKYFISKKVARVGFEPTAKGL